jgi:hypothetical protein
MAEGARCTAFQGARRIASGAIADVAAKVKTAIDADDTALVLIFDDATSELVEIDFRGSRQDVLKRLAAHSEERGRLTSEDQSARGPGRPRLGVIAREVTLLPRHWEWLNHQPGGASVALRKLVEEARRANIGKDRSRRAQESTYRFISAIAGDAPCFEEAARSLFAGDAARFDEAIDAWPSDIRQHAKRLAADAFAA